MPGVRIGIQLASLRQPLKKALHTAARLGADGVEIDLRHELRSGELTQTAIRQFRKLLDDLNLSVSAAAFPTRRGYTDLDDLDRRIGATQSAMQLAYRLGAKTVINRLGPIPGDTESAEYGRLVDVLTLLGAHGNRVGTQFAAQTGDEEGSLLADLLAAVPDGTIGVDFHPGRLVAAGFSLSTAMDRLGPQVCHVHAADALWDGAARRGQEVQMGRGLVDIPELAARLEEFDYRGWWTIERRSPSATHEEIAMAVEYLRRVGL